MTGLGQKVCAAAAAGFLMMACAACSGTAKPAYSHFEQIGPDGWDPYDLIVFEPWTADSADAFSHYFDFDLVLRYSVRMPIADLHLAVTFEDEDGVVSTDTLKVCYGAGGNAGIKSRYGVREARIALGRDISLRDGYAVSVSPVAVRERTAGLLNVGLVMTESRGKGLSHK